MTFNSDCNIDIIRALHRKGGNPLLVVQNNQSLGITANTISDVQGGTGSGSQVVGSGSIGATSYGSDAVLLPSSSPESYQPTYKEQLEFDLGIEVL